MDPFSLIVTRLLTKLTDLLWDRWPWRKKPPLTLLVPCSVDFYQVEEEPKRGTGLLWRASNGNVLCLRRAEVCADLKQGDPVVFVLEQQGQPQPVVKAELEGIPVPLRPNVHAQAEGRSERLLWVLSYPFHPDRRGRQQTLKVTFPLPGPEHPAVYRMEHGRRVLKPQ